ncbi:MAG: hypothetical protein JRJ42_10525 [Deltaproteobacteria bacterium]|nr:hypothetical protein [Deltaproteobacteria bacterium]MBW2021055.1 hypothetical protein [Deltaproteobacteria bacterium]
MTFLEFIITALLADHLASQQEEAKGLDRLKEEIEDLRWEIDRLKHQEED